ncbi:MAG: GNAT family N-acetyltransferase [Dehalococcoidia bacterium]
MPNHTIQPATLHDAEALAALHHLSHTTSFAAFSTAEFINSRRLDYYRKQWQDFLTNPPQGASAWTARPFCPSREGGNPVGAAQRGRLPGDPPQPPPNDAQNASIAEQEKTKDTQPQIIGMVRVTPMPEPHLAQLSAMHVHPEAQGQGIGRALMQVAEDFMRETGYTRAILGVVLANKPARSLYESFGWTPIEYHEKGIEGVPYATYEKRFGG